MFIPTGDEFNTNLVGLKNYQGEVPEFNENLKTCPENEPFFDGDSCIGCSLPQFVDFDTDSCKYCPDDKHFNILNRQCEV